MESKVSNVNARTASTEVPAVDLTADGPEPRYELTPLGYDRLIRARASLHWLKRQTGDSTHLDMLAAFLSEIEAIFAEVTIAPLPDRCTAAGL